MEKHENPLFKYFRVPGVHIKLPTNGAFLPEGSIEFAPNGDLPVYPMRSADELLLKSPDALMSGFAIEEMLKSCVPGIKRPRLVSNPDLDVLLLAIRTATYGETITISPICPVCSTVNEVSRNLSYLMSTMTIVPAENPVRLSDEVIAYLRPYNIQNAITLGSASFEEARSIQALEINKETTDEERITQMNSSMKRITDLTMEALADSIIKIVIPDGEVTDKADITEFIQNISKVWTEKLQDTLDGINSKGIDKTYDVVCEKCQHEWKSEVDFNPTTFFGASS